MKTKIDLKSVVLFLLAIAYFAAAAKTGGHGLHGKGFFNGG